jgi:protoporphyrin/coproporphyrin ferrochelatase
MARYVGKPSHYEGEPCTGILLINAGSPDAPTFWPVRRFLAQFLGDPRIIEFPRWLWLPLLHGIILNVRPRHLARSYRTIWRTSEHNGKPESPLLLTSHRQAAALQNAVAPHFNERVKVGLAMTYGNPSVQAGLDLLRRADVRRVLVFPLYPQYSGASVGASFDAVAQVLSRWRWVPELRFINSYHDHPGYIQALADRIRLYWSEFGRADQLLMSFHGLPMSYLLSGDPYYYECQQTARLLAEELKLPEEQYTVVFQSRYGPAGWLKPYLDEMLKMLPEQGMKSVQVVSPAFSADCSETLKEIAIEGRKIFLAAGGESFGYIPALNDDPGHIKTLAEIALQHTQDWQGERHDPRYQWTID